MIVHRIHPLVDPRWTELVASAPQSSVFHTAGWLDALRRTYGYQPLAYTTSPPSGRLTNAIVVSSIRSWLTGARLVSGAFSDHCDPLFTDETDLRASIDALHEDTRRQGLQYFELRPTTGNIGTHRLIPHGHYWRHVIDLHPTIEALFARCHKTAVQQATRRARRESLRIESGRSDALVSAFYSLFVATRRRHDLPPPPLAWFRNLIACLGDAFTIHVALKEDRPIAAIVLLRHRDVVVYKYGASDASMHALGAVPFLLWHAIEEAKRAGLQQIDFGRSEMDQHGLIAFKERFGATRTTMTYFRSSVARQSAARWLPKRVTDAIVRTMPDGALQAVGRVLYRHVA